MALVAVLAACALADAADAGCDNTKRDRYCEKMVSKQKCGKRKIAMIKCPAHCLERCGVAPGTGTRCEALRGTERSYGMISSQYGMQSKIAISSLLAGDLRHTMRT